MPQIKARILISDASRGIGSTGTSPLRFAYVRHEPLGPTYVTDADGVVRDKDGNAGIASLTGWADVTVHCQNTIVRVLEPNTIFCPTVGLTFTGETEVDYTINTGTPGVSLEKMKQFRLLNQFAECYQLVWRQFEPFRGRDEFPLGRRADLEETRNQAKRIDAVFPADMAGAVRLLGGSVASLLLALAGNRILSFVDPVGTGGWPRIFVEPDPPECRVFGANAGSYPNGNRRGLELAPAELAHALHFSLLSQADRDRIRRDYLFWLLTRAANLQSPTHAIGVATTPMVAFIEAIDHFSHRFSTFMRARSTAFPGAISDATRAAYIEAEVSGALTAGSGNCYGSPLTRVAAPFGLTTRLPVRDIPGRPPIAIDPRFGGAVDLGAGPFTGTALNGGNDEGALLGALFVDLADRTDLRLVMEAVLESRRLDFGSFRRWFNTAHPQHEAKLDAVAVRWGL